MERRPRPVEVEIHYSDCLAGVYGCHMPGLWEQVCWYISGSVSRNGCSLVARLGHQTSGCHADRGDCLAIRKFLEWVARILESNTEDCCQLY